MAAQQKQRSRQEDMAREYQALAKKLLPPKQAKSVVITPQPAVDFIIKSAEAQLAAQGAEWGDPGVRCIDPFAGSGIFQATVMLRCKREKLPRLMDNLIAIELWEPGAELCKRNLEQLYAELTGARKYARVFCLDTFLFTGEIEDLLQFPPQPQLYTAANCPLCCGALPPRPLLAPKAAKR